MKKFSELSSPSITVMLKSTRRDELIEEIKLSIAEGADSFCLLYEGLEPESKTDESAKAILSATEGMPVYVTNYIRGDTCPDETDDERAERLLDLLSMGASLIDVRTDMFCPSDDEVTENPEAVLKQMRLIEEIHARGAEVIMSSHIFRFVSPEEVLRIAMLQRERGADIAKIVTVADTEEELDEAYRTIFLLKRSLGIPFLYLINGKMHRSHRMLSGALGSRIYLCRENSYTGLTQPTVEDIKSITDILLQGDKHDG